MLASLNAHVGAGIGSRRLPAGQVAPAIWVAYSAARRIVAPGLLFPFLLHVPRLLVARKAAAAVRGADRAIRTGDAGEWPTPHEQECRATEDMASGCKMVGKGREGPLARSAKTASLRGVEDIPPSGESGKALARGGALLQKYRSFLYTGGGRRTRIPVVG
jgi:hypothetical protein